ncbi:MAG: hypothetical protein OIF32_07505 [Campylobacterales bacterium]|nr:hypothetical protein [Campylobacterales bacterium]
MVSESLSLFNYPKTNDLFSSNISRKANSEIANDIPLFDDLLKETFDLIQAIEEKVFSEISNRIQNVFSNNQNSELSSTPNILSFYGNGTINTADNEKVNFNFQMHFVTFYPTETFNKTTLEKPMFVNTPLRQEEVIGNFNPNFNFKISNSLADNHFRNFIDSNNYSTYTPLENESNFPQFRDTTSNNYRESHKPYIRQKETKPYMMEEIKLPNIEQPSINHPILDIPLLQKEEPLYSKEMLDDVIINTDPNRDDCFVAIDKDYEGLFDNGNYEFVYGTSTGFDGLHKYDDNKDGLLNQNDKVFRDLEIWRLNDQGKRETFSLTDYGVHQLNINKSTIVYNENVPSLNKTANQNMLSQLLQSA